MLDGSEVVGTTLRGSGLQCQERFGVAPHHRLQVPYGDPQADAVRVPERQRGTEMLDRLGVGEDLPSQEPGRPVGVGCLCVPPGELEVPGHRTGGCAGDLGGTSVQQPSSGQPRVLVDECPLQLVDEVVVEPPLDHEAAAYDFLQRRDRLFLGPPAHHLDGVGSERTTEHGGGCQHLPARLAHLVESPAQELAHTCGQRHGILLEADLRRYSTRSSGAPSESSR